MNKRLRNLMLSAACVLAVGAVAVRAAESGYALDWFSHDAGGAMHAAPVNGYVLNATLGQSDAAAAGGAVDGYTLSGGFWVSSRPAGVYLPVVQRR